MKALGHQQQSIRRLSRGHRTPFNGQYVQHFSIDRHSPIAPRFVSNKIPVASAITSPSTHTCSARISVGWKPSRTAKTFSYSSPTLLHRCSRRLYAHIERWLSSSTRDLPSSSTSMFSGKRPFAILSERSRAILGRLHPECLRHVGVLRW